MLRLRSSLRHITTRSVQLRFNVNARNSSTSFDTIRKLTRKDHEKILYEASKQPLEQILEAYKENADKEFTKRSELLANRALITTEQAKVKAKSTIKGQGMGRRINTNNKFSPPPIDSVKKSFGWEHPFNKLLESYALENETSTIYDIMELTKTNSNLATITGIPRVLRLLEKVGPNPNEICKNKTVDTYTNTSGRGRGSGEHRRPVTLDFFPQQDAFINMISPWFTSQLSNTNTSNLESNNNINININNKCVHLSTESRQQHFYHLSNEIFKRCENDILGIKFNQITANNSY